MLTATQRVPARARTAEPARSSAFVCLARQPANVKPLQGFGWLTPGRDVCYGRRDMTSGVEMGRDAQARGDACVSRAGDARLVARNRSKGLTLTHEMFSARVGSSTAKLRNSDVATTGLGAASSF